MPAAADAGQSRLRVRRRPAPPAAGHLSGGDGGHHRRRRYLHRLLRGLYGGGASGGGVSGSGVPCGGHRRVTTRRRSVYPHHGRGAALHPPARGVDRIWCAVPERSPGPCILPGGVSGFCRRQPAFPHNTKRGGISIGNTSSLCAETASPHRAAAPMMPASLPSFAAAMVGMAPSR